MKSHPLTSIIIPIYNVEKYLDECVESVVSQTYRNLEIILVDDKSPDKSGKIADGWADKDQRIRVIHKSKNEGLNMARKSGFDNSNGELITFVDSDDVVDRRYIEKLHRSLAEHKADVSICSYSSFESNPELSMLDNYREEVFSRDEIIKHYATCQLYLPDYHGNLVNAHCKLFKRSVIENIDWKKCNYTLGEDDFFSLYALSSVKKAVIIYDDLYYYRMSPNSLSRSSELNVKFNENKISVFQIVDNYKKLASELLGRKYQDEVYYHTYYLYNYYFGLLFTKSAWNEYEFNHLVKVTANNLGSFLEVKKYPIDLERLLKIKETGVISWFNDIIVGERMHNKNLTARVAHLENELSIRGVELSSHLGIKRSTRLLAGNIKRRIGRRRQYNHE